MSAELLASRRDATLMLTISHPGTGNALHPDLCAAAIEVLSTAERDDTVRAVVVTGAGASFCAGSDMHGLLESRCADDAQAEAIDHLYRWIEAIRDCPKPVIAAVEGLAAGAGLALALHCDLIVAAASAQFAAAGARFGLPPEGGASWLLMQALPRQTAAEILFDGKPLSAARLQALGVVNRVVPDGLAAEAALAWCDELAQASPRAIERIKTLLNRAPGSTLAEQARAERLALVESLYDPDARAGLQALGDDHAPLYK